MMSVSKMTWRRMIGLLMNNELESMLWPICDIVPGNVYRNRKATRNISKYGRSPGRDLPNTIQDW